MEPAVWEKIEELLSKPQLGGEILNSARGQFESRSKRKEVEKAQSRIKDLDQQTEVLAERLAELPRSISPAPLYKQMEKMAALKIEEEKHLDNFRRAGEVDQAVVDLSSYQELLTGLRALKDRPGAAYDRAKIIRNLVHRVEVTPNSFKIHFHVGENEIHGGLAKAGPLFSSLGNLWTHEGPTRDFSASEDGSQSVLKNFSNFIEKNQEPTCRASRTPFSGVGGSRSLTNGWLDWD